MTVAEVQVQVNALAEYLEQTGDNEETHSREDELHQQVLRAIAEGQCDDPRACAKVALKTRDLHYERWYS